MLKFIVFQLVASTPAGEPVYSVADIVEPLPRYNSKILRGARRIAGPRGYVLVGRADIDWPAFDVMARRIDGTY